MPARHAAKFVLNSLVGSVVQPGRTDLVCVLAVVALVTALANVSAGIGHTTN